MVVVVRSEETRKGPWTEEEDSQLMSFVALFGERRWDFIARVSGLNRTGKSCRLRWVNYLHPGLKRGRMSPQEERLILELHACWGNRWSRIARKLPGRTDNEIKNYWRTHMRKKAQERKRTTASTSSSSSSPSSSSSSLSSPAGDPPPPPPQHADVLPCQHVISGSHDHVGGRESSREGGVVVSTDSSTAAEIIRGYCYPMEKIWDEIGSPEMSGPSGLSHDEYTDEACCNNTVIAPVCSPPLWDTTSSLDDDSVLWKMDYEEELMKSLLSTSNRSLQPWELSYIEN